MRAPSTSAPSSDNLYMGALVPRARARETESLAEVFAMFPRLRERRRQLARTLSGGERQMLAIGRALMACPDLLLLDEPSLGLQPSLVRTIIETIRRINERGISVLLIEQNVHFSLPISHRGYVLEQGRVVLEDAGAALLENPHVRLSYLGM
jgi:branched-chain amino acid transport system ATP-binding protein